MSSNYMPIIQANLTRAFDAHTDRLAQWLPAEEDRDGLIFRAFGAHCRVTPDTVILGGREATGPRGVIISLYLKHAAADTCIAEPWRAFAELPDSRPYVGAFASHTETPLVPHVAKIAARQEVISNALAGAPLTGRLSGDLVLQVTPLPKIRLVYIFYLADEDFPASAKCLLSNNADKFLPVDGLADVGEYTSRAMISLLG